MNGKSLTEYFGRLHDRESAVWALKATQRLDKYNVWAVASGGGTTGQAEAIMLAVSKALMAHEPDLKPALRLGKNEVLILARLNILLIRFLQLAPSHVTLSVSRGRSPASLRLARCLPGSSVKRAFVSPCTEYVLHTRFQLVNNLAACVRRWQTTY